LPGGCANIFMKMEQRTLKAAYRFFCNKELTDARTKIKDRINKKLGKEVIDEIVLR